MRSKYLDPRVRKAERYSREIQAGIVSVNNVVALDHRVPFGGVKKAVLVDSCQDM